MAMSNWVLQSVYLQRQFNTSVLRNRMKTLRQSKGTTIPVKRKAFSKTVTLHSRT